MCCLWESDFRLPIYCFTFLDWFTILFQYYTQTGLPGKRLDPNICAVCGNQIIVTNNDDAIIENTCKLDCDHMYPFKENDEEHMPSYTYVIIF